LREASAAVGIGADVERRRKSEREKGEWAKEKERRTGGWRKESRVGELSCWESENAG
jgi:hypothetical protein